uniref:Uncharacterized protein n=1 Tax=Arundo donax TaxID=35708 RepID=A0A0A9GJN5_ARUDO
MKRLHLSYLRASSRTFVGYGVLQISSVFVIGYGMKCL